MYIAPDSTIKILHNVPLDKTYEHTIHFVTQEAQLEYFNSKVKYTLTDYTYQRMERDYIRVAKKTEDLYDCNYVMYQNSAFGNKWFFAFLDQPNYINNEVCELQITIDVMQTWRFDYLLESCFVERMTPKRDFIGDNIVPEPVELGEYVYNNQNAQDQYNNLLVGRDVGYKIVVAICDVEETTVEGKIYDGIYGGATLYVYSMLDVDELNAFLAGYVQKPEAVIGIYMIPGILVPVIPSDHKLPNGSLSHEERVEYDPPDATWTIDGYLPNNCKLYTYPYNFLNINNGSGTAMAMRYEFFENLKPKFLVSGCVTQPVSMIAKPTHYKFIPADNLTMLDAETLELTNYPVCSWNTDAYKAWVAQNTLPSIVNTVQSAGLGAVTGMLAGGHPVVGAVLGAVHALISINDSLYQASIQADIAKGNFAGGNVLTAQGRQHFYKGRMSVSYQYARIIDHFFDRFGYAQKRHFVPERHNRPLWTYIKTAGCEIHGQMPQDDMKKICEIYDRGCLFYTPESNCIFGGDNRPVANSRGYNPAYVRNGYNPD